MCLWADSTFCLDTIAAQLCWDTCTARMAFIDIVTKRTWCHVEPVKTLISWCIPAGAGFLAYTDHLWDLRKYRALSDCTDTQSDLNCCFLAHSRFMSCTIPFNCFRFITGPPPVTLYVGSKRAICHLMRDNRPLCCLEWGVVSTSCFSPDMPHIFTVDF